MDGRKEGPRQVLNYIGRYSHSIAISNHQIKNIGNGKIKFTYKNYSNGGKVQVKELGHWEFIRRLTMHIIPHRFVRIRHYGILSNRNKKQALIAARKSLEAREPKPAKTKNAGPSIYQIHYCSCCEKLTPHIVLAILPPCRAGPELWLTLKL